MFARANGSRMGMEFSGVYLLVGLLFDTRG